MNTCQRMMLSAFLAVAAVAPGVGAAGQVDLAVVSVKMPNVYKNEVEVVIANNGEVAARPAKVHLHVDGISIPTGAVLDLDHQTSAISPKGTSKMLFSVEAKYNLGAAKYTVTVEAPKSGDANPENNVLKGVFPGKL